MMWILPVGVRPVKFAARFKNGNGSMSFPKVELRFGKEKELLLLNGGGKMVKTLLLILRKLCPCWEVVELSEQQVNIMGGFCMTP